MNTDPVAQDLRDRLTGAEVTLAEVLEVLPRGMLERVSAELGVYKAPLSTLPAPAEIRTALVNQMSDIPDAQIENVISEIHRFSVRSGVSALSAADQVSKNHARVHQPVKALIARLVVRLLNAEAPTPG